MLDEEKIFSNEQIDVYPNIIKKIDKQRPVLSFIKYVKKNKPLIIAFFSIIFFAIVVYFLIPQVKFGNTILVNFGTEIKLEKGQTAKLKTNNISIKILNFVNDSCPKNQECFWSGQSVEYLMTINDQQYATGSINNRSNQGYKIETKSSDYKKYAIIKIIKVNED